MSQISWSKDLFHWGVFIRPLKGVDVLMAAFVFEPDARKYGATYPKESRAIVRWIGEGNPPNIDGGFEALTW